MWFTNSYDRYDFAFGETRNLSSSSLVKVHHSLVRARARANTCVRGIEQTCGSLVVIAFALQPASSRRGPQRIRLFGPFRLGPQPLQPPVEPRRLELLTSALQRRRSTN